MTNQHVTFATIPLRPSLRGAVIKTALVSTDIRKNNMSDWSAEVRGVCHG